MNSIKALPKDVQLFESPRCEIPAPADTTPPPVENNYLALQWITAISAQMALLALAIIAYPLITLTAIAVATAAYSAYQFFTTPKRSDDDGEYGGRNCCH